MEITEDRREFIKNNNIIVKVNNYDEACDIVDIIADCLDIKISKIIFGFLDITGFDYISLYIVKKNKNREIIMTNNISNYEDSKEIYHEFTTRNFIDAFID